MKRKNGPITARIVAKSTEKSYSSINSLIMKSPAWGMLDIPFERPVNYHLRLDDGYKATVSKEVYEHYQVGDKFTYLPERIEDTVLAALLIVVVLAIVFGGLIFYAWR